MILNLALAVNPEEAAGSRELPPAASFYQVLGDKLLALHTKLVGDGRNLRLVQRRAEGAAAVAAFGNYGACSITSSKIR